MSLKDQNAFTLIELLVVVLIIGVLTAIALPQYQKAVEKSRAMQGLALTKSVSSFIDSYYLVNNEYPHSFEETGAEISWKGTQKWYNATGDVRSNDEWSFQLENQGIYVSLLMGRLNGPYAGGGFVLQYAHNNSLFSPILGRIICVERTGTDFVGSPGDFCTKLLGASFLFTAGPFSYFELP